MTISKTFNIETKDDNEETLFKEVRKHIYYPLDIERLIKYPELIKQQTILDLSNWLVDDIAMIKE